MIGSFVFRILALVLGYAYPAYECFKIVELNRPDIEQLNFWCQYWILVAVLTVLERIGDTFISWLPMYNEAKVAFFVYLWYPKTRGATYVYETFFSPYVSSHETEIDHILLELKTRAGDFVILYWKKAASYVQSRTFEILQYVASQAPSQESRRQPTQQAQPEDPGHQTPLVTMTQDSKIAAIPSSSQTNCTPAISTTKANQEPAKIEVLLQSQLPTKQSRLPIVTPSLLFHLHHPQEEVDQVDVGAVITAATGKNSASLSESHFEEGVRITRARLRKRNADFGPSSLGSNYHLLDVA
ncbi:hypothetical protein HPP92_003534 [Vanilla planifolia]|uniref:HVA22-like protein n=1 Tax=Vanilla planifolia TaxID=51239 RepID=A0A835S7N8_VANPL|nr:hypothetical protein HPP92_003534 [Vanilla planifolia]